MVRIYAGLPVSQAPVTVGYTRVSSYRIGEIRRSSAPPPAEGSCLRLLAELLLAAAWVDGKTSGRERHSLRKIEARVAGAAFPDGLNEHIADFELAHFDLDATCRGLGALPVEERRYVAELVQWRRSVIQPSPCLRMA